MDDPKEAQRMRQLEDGLIAIARSNINSLIEHANEHGTKRPASVVALADHSGISKSALYRWVGKSKGDAARRRLPLTHLAGIADAYGIPAWTLLIPGLDPGKSLVFDTQEEIQQRSLALGREIFEMLTKAAYERTQQGGDRGAVADTPALGKAPQNK